VAKNKLAKFADLATYDHVIQMPIRYGEQEDFKWKGKWNAEFFKNTNPIVLELGCGKGEYTVNMAEHFPEKNFIGIDIKGARMWRGARQAFEKQLPNVAFVRTNIEFVNCFFAEGEIAEIWLTFPDPQMKKATRRLTASNFMELYRNMLVPSGIVHLKTDSNFQYKYTEAMVAENRLEVIKKTDDLYNSDMLDDVLSIKTFYEKQWLERGIPIKYIAFRLSHHEPLREPDVEIEKDPYRSFGRSAREHNE
jgi:tRNA (guanine-N7-)-methyltransferase